MGRGCGDDSPGATLWDAKLLAWAGNNRDLFSCPANKLAPKWTNNVVLPVRNPSYDYNMAGTGQYDPGIIITHSLGLDGGLNWGAGAAHYLRENEVTAPGDMIAVADVRPLVGFQIGDGNNDGDDVNAPLLPLFSRNLLAELAPRHDNGENVVFCDGHVEYAKQPVWLTGSVLQVTLGQASNARRRWNNDHEPHPETGTR